MSLPYRVRDWDSHFENSESRKVKHPRWVPVPNRHDGKGYRRLLKHQRHVEIFCAWCLILQVASRMPERGVLADEDGPLDADDLADKTGFPPEIFDLALKVLSAQKIGWICDGRESGESPGTSGDAGMASRHAGVEGKGIEGNGREGKESPASRGDAPAGFDRWWKLWPSHPRKVGKSKCLREWKRRKLEPIAETVISTLRLATESADWRKQGGAFIPMPMTWLDRAPWETAPEDLESPDGDSADPFGPVNYDPPREITDALDAPDPVVGRPVE